MKTSFILSQTRKNHSVSLLAIIFTFFSLSLSFGQQAVERVYATGATLQSGLGAITNLNLAKDGNISTSSTMSIGLIGSVSQRVSFPAPVTNKPVHIKLGAGTGLLSLLPTITVQAFNGGDTDGSFFSTDYRVGTVQTLSGSGLLSLLNGTNTYEYIYTPSTSASYDRIKVTFSAVAVGAVSIHFYDAYYEQPVPGPIPCDTYADLLSGSTGALASGLTTVINPTNAVNGDENDFAELVGAVSAVNSTYLEVLYPGTSRVGDSIRILVEKPASLLEVGLLDAIEVFTYNGNTQIDAKTGVSLLRLQPLTGTNKYWISFASDGSFDRVKIQLGGAVSLLSSLKIYEIQRVAAAPTVTTSNVTIYVGHTATLEAIANLADAILWTPGNITSAIFTTPALMIVGTTDYEVQATRNGCSNLSAKAKATVTVLSDPLPVTLVSFRASKEGAAALLAWATTEETNSERFDIQRSQNGKIWEVIGTRTAANEGMGMRYYALTDASPLNGRNLYRLKMIDRDGTFAYSPIESIAFNIDNTRVFPNPVTNAENIKIAVDDWNKVKSVRVISSAGKVVFESSNALSTGINTRNLSSGLYLVQILRTNGTVNAYKVVKQ